VRFEYFFVTKEEGGEGEEAEDEEHEVELAE
jgi:hypothetical protein